jgi:hypothetical protein
VLSKSPGPNCLCTSIAAPIIFEEISFSDILLQFLIFFQKYKKLCDLCDFAVKNVTNTNMSG